MQVEQLQQAIEVLSEEDFIQLRQWFAEKDWERWDRQLESDIAAGKLSWRGQNYTRTNSWQIGAW